MGPSGSSAVNHGAAISVGSSRGQMGTSSLLREMWLFMRVRKKFWLLPVILVLFLVGALLIITQGSALAPFIYTVF